MNEKVKGERFVCEGIGGGECGVGIEVGYVGGFVGCKVREGGFWVGVRVFVYWGLEEDFRVWMG